MPGFNYGGKGDGTGWSSESGSGPEPGGGSHGNGGGRENSGNSSSNTPSPAQRQISEIQNDPAIRQKLFDMILAARMINPAAKLKIESISPTGTMGISVTGLNTEQAKTLGLGGLVMGVSTNNISVVVGDIETGHKISGSANSTGGGVSPTQIEKSPAGIYLSVLQGDLPAGYWLNNGKVMTTVSVERTSGGGGKNGNERTWTVKVDQEDPQLTAAYNESVRIRQEAADRIKAEENARALAEEEARAIASGKSKAEFDAGKRVEAAQAAINTAQLNVNNLSGAVSAANQVITQKQAEMGPLNNELAEANKRVQDTIKYINDPILNRIHFNMLSARVRAQNNVDTKQNEINAAVANRDGLNAQLSQANINMQNALNEKSAADAALSAATAQRLQAEAALRAATQAAEEARQRQAEEVERQRQAMEVAEKAKDEREVLEKTSELIADMGDKIGEHLGEKYKSIAKDIADNIKNFQGRSIRSFDDAMASLNKILSNPDLKIYQDDRNALVNAWKHVDAQDMANKLGNLSKAFKVADVVMKIEKVREKSIEGYETGNWGPLMLEVESWVLSGMASAVALGIFSATLGAYALSLGVSAIAVGIAGILLAAAVGALIDDKFADALNNEIIRPAH